MKTSDYIAELKQKYPGIELRANVNRPGLSNVFVNGVEICPVPSDEIKDEPDRSYRYVFPNGASAPHNSKRDVVAKIEAIMRFINSNEGQELMNE